MKGNTLSWVASGVVAAGLLLSLLAEDVLNAERRVLSDTPTPPRGPCAPCMAARLARAERDQAERAAKSGAVAMGLPADFLEKLTAEREAEQTEAEDLAERLAAGRSRMAAQEAARMVPRSPEGVAAAAEKWAARVNINMPALVTE